MFNKELIENISTTLNEGYSGAMGKLYVNMYEYRALCKKIEDVQKQLEDVIGKEFAETFAQYINACENRASYEQKYMYIEGMKDYRDIVYFVEHQALDDFLLNYDFKYDI